MSYPFPNISEPPAPGVTVKRLFLIRHGETDANASGILQGRGINLDLSERGRRQAEAMGNRFKDVPVDHIIVTALKRTAETASYIQKYHPTVSFEKVSNLDEISWGEWEGGPFHQGIKDLHASWEDANFAGMQALNPALTPEDRSPGGESAFDVEDRAVPDLYRIIQQDATTFVFVVHGRLLRIVLASILRRDLRLMSTYKHHNTCINVVDVAISNDPSHRDALAKFRGHDFENLKDHTQKPLTSPNISHPESLAFRVIKLDDIDHLEGIGKVQY
ncbi:hypothetical protein HDU97_003424 [Phlyctochytrium planicorne]|nr:hypothetical protein HDU97_003424 [Phlyctochytrium planicorne]